MLAGACSSAPKPPLPTHIEQALNQYKKGQDLERSGNLAAALDAYLIATQLDPHFPQAHVARARLQHQQEHWEEAEKDYTKAIEVAPPDRKALYHFIRARFYHQRDNYQEAEQDYTAALEHEGKLPDEYHVDLLMHRALLYLDTRRFVQARTDYERVLFLNPDDQTRKQVMEWLEKTRSRPGTGVVPASASKTDSSATP